MNLYLINYYNNSFEKSENFGENAIDFLCFFKTRVKQVLHHRSYRRTSQVGIERKF